MTRRSSLLAVLSALAACDDRVFPAPDLERMIDQPRYEPYEANPFFQDGRAMRRVPEGTVARSAPSGDERVVHGTTAGTYVDRVPIRVTRELVHAGRRRFDVFCAPCHGVSGDGASRVAVHMRLRRPPNLLIEPVRSLPDGRIYRVISEGYGLMRSYAEDLPTPEERWSIVAYVRALQRSQSVEIDRLPEPIRKQAEEALR